MKLAIFMASITYPILIESSEPAKEILPQNIEKEYNEY